MDARRPPRSERRRGADAARASVLFPLLLLALSQARAASGQEGLIGRWTVDYLGASWAPRWSAPADASVPSAAAAARIGVFFQADALRLRSAVRQDASSAHVTVRQPVSSRLALRVSAGGDARRTLSGGRTLIDTPRSQAFAGGVEAGHTVGTLGVAEVVAMLGWDGGVGGEGWLSLVGERYSVGVRGWRTRSQTSLVFFPADSLRDVGIRQHATGLRVDAGATLDVGPVTLRPAARLELTSLDEVSDGSDSFLVASPPGETSLVELGLGASRGRWEVRAEHGRRDIAMESRLFRGQASAGRLFYANAEHRSWAGRLATRLASGLWSLRIVRERSTGALSTRVETWPFVSLWEQITTQAYRLRGDLDGSALALTLGREPLATTGWSWAVTAGRYALRADRQSWFVTSFGFGRSEEEESVQGVDPAILVGSEVGRTFRLGPGHAEVRVEGALPVHASGTPGSAPGLGAPQEEGLPGYLSVALGWWW